MKTLVNWTYLLKKRLSFLLLGLLIFSCSEGAKKLTQDGDQLMITGDFQGAIIKYTEAVALNNKQYQAYHNRGCCHMELGNIKSAIKDFNHSIFLNDTFGLAYLNRGILNYQRKLYKPALRDLLIADSLKIHDDRLTLLKGNCLFKLGAYKLAIPALESSLTLYPDSSSLILALGISNFKSINYNNSIKYLNQYIDLDPESITGITYLARSYFSMDSLNLCINAYENLFELASDIGKKDRDNYLASLIIRAKNYVAKRDFASAINDYTKILSIDPKNPNAYYDRGLLNLKFGRTYEGCEDLGKAFENGHPDAMDIMTLSCYQFLN